MLPKFEMERLDRRLPTPMKVAMLEVITAFANLDTLLSSWLVNAYGMKISLGALLVENMDIANKIQRLKKVYEHIGNSEEPDNLKKLKDDFDRFKDVRNTIAHATCVGVDKKDRNNVIFSPMRAVLREHGHLQVVMITGAHMLAARDWALHAVQFVNGKVEALQAQREEPAPSPDEAPD